jgi:hypothetical protein
MTFFSSVGFGFGEGPGPPQQPEYPAEQQSWQMLLSKL